MKQYLSLLVAVALAAGILPSRAQMGGPPVPQMANGMDKLFGANQTFSADAQIQASNGGRPITMSCKMAFDKGNARFELDMTQMQGAAIPPQAMGMMKSAGLDKMVSITQAGAKTVYVVYPNAQAYTEMTPAASDVGGTNADVPVQYIAMGNETVAGHPCVKNKAVVTDKNGVQHTFMVWNATDLKNFPVQLTMNDEDSPVTFTYQNISFAKPDASQFTLPSGYTKYDSMQEMTQAQMMKNLPGGGFPGGFRPPQQ